MKNCERCGKEIDGSYGSGKFCSRQCSNARVFSEESNEKKSVANKKRFKESGAWGFQSQTKEQRQAATKKTIQTWNGLLLSESFNEMSFDRKRKRVILEQDKKCHRCGLGEWQGERLSLEIEHLNGNSQDDSRENLIALCPNCHSLTKTWRGRNIRAKKDLKSTKEIYEAYKKEGNIRGALLSLGMAAKGANYHRVRRSIREHQWLDKSLDNQTKLS